VTSSPHLWCADRFWSRVRKGDSPDACWLWKGGRLPTGYGKFHPSANVRLYAHRASWEMANGVSVPPGMFVCHRCDNPPCVNPAHLFLGTPADNVADKCAKGRHRNGASSGEKNPNSKLTTVQVIEIRGRLQAGESRRLIAGLFGVSKATIKQIATGRIWSSV